MDKLKSFFDYIKTVVNDKIKKYVVEKFFYGSLSGIKGFLAKIGLKYLANNIIGPSIDYVKRKYRKLVNKIKSKKQIKDIKEAKDEDTLADRFRDLP